MIRIVIPLSILLYLLSLVNSACGAAITPEFIRNLPPLPKEAVAELKKHENYSLAVGNVTTVTVSGNNDIGYGVTPDEVKDAVTEGILPKGTRFPRRMTKKQADEWYVDVTIPTYRSIVRKTVTVPLTLGEEASLVFFVQNTGRSNLEKLVDQPGRLNDGDYKSVEEVMPLYYSKDRPEKAGLQKRLRFMLDVYKGKPFARK